jgi:hypothetical protein
MARASSGCWRRRGTQDSSGIRNAPRKVLLETLVNKHDAARGKGRVEFLGSGKKADFSSILILAMEVRLTFTNRNARSPLGDSYNNTADLTPTANSVLLRG